jgi:hypothetical protein
VSDFWFKPKTFGYGATPANWKGWAVTLAFVALMVGWSLASPGLLRWTDWAIWSSGVVVLTGVFIALSRHKTDGEWKWRGFDR